VTSEYVGIHEIKDINKQVDRILLELGNPEPPLSLELVRELLRLDLRYYSGSDPTHLEEVAHKLRIAGKQIALRPGIIVDVFKKFDLSALWLPDKKRILIDADTPKLKHRWIEGHEIGHGIIPWHSGLMFGDNKQTLNPACDDIIEAEANYASGRLLFLGDRFADEVRDLELDFVTIKKIAKDFGNTITSTLWRMVEERVPDQAIFGMISKHPNHLGVGKSEEKFIRSKRFREKFGNVQMHEAYNILTKHASHNKGGKIVDVEDVLVDVNGETFEFRVESFSNTHDVLTYGVCIGKKHIIVPVKERKPGRTNLTP